MSTRGHGEGREGPPAPEIHSKLPGYIQYIQNPCAVRDHSAHMEKVTDITPSGSTGQKQHSIKPGLQPGLNQG